MKTETLLLVAAGGGIVYLIILDRQRQADIADLQAQLARARRRRPRSTLEYVAEGAISFLEGIF